MAEYEITFQIKFSGGNGQKPVTKTDTFMVDDSEASSEEEAEKILLEIYENHGEERLVDISDMDIHNLGDSELDILETKKIL